MSTSSNSEAKSTTNSTMEKIEEEDPDLVADTPSQQMKPLDMAKFCAELVTVPQELPEILKNYGKAAIRTQPKNLLIWSAAYFRAKADGEIPPVKERIEYPLKQSAGGLSPGLLRVLHKQLGAPGQEEMVEFVPLPLLEVKWKGLALSSTHLEEILSHAGVAGRDTDGDDFVEWKKFLVVAANSICPGLKETMRIICYVCTPSLESTAWSMDFQDWVDMYKYGAEDLKQVPPEKIAATIEKLSAKSTQTIAAKDFNPPIQLE